ncbi:hypothetical protein C7212DRAFT_308073, partial [Tuber magnatum]
HDARPRPPSIHTISTASAPVPPVISPPPTKPTEFGHSKIPGAAVRKAVRRPGAKEIKCCETSVGDYEK